MERAADFKLLNSHAAIIVAVVLGAIQLNIYVKHRKFVRNFGKADYVLAFNPLTALGMIFGWGTRASWKMRDTLYRKPHKELICVEPVLWGNPQLYTNSVEVLRQISGEATSMTWVKPDWSTTFSTYWGNNVFAENGGEWRRHRRILQPSFNPRTYEMVWSETTRLYQGMLSSSNMPWPTQSGEIIAFKKFHEITHRLALCVILSCGFGLSLTWDEKAYAEQGQVHVSVDEGIMVQSDNLLLTTFAPEWLFALPFEKLRRIKRATNAMRKWFNETVANKKKEVAHILSETNGGLNSKELRRDLFSRLILASQTDGKTHLKDSELIGNTWIMSFAGHETTAATLVSTLCFLAYYTIEQSIVYDEICSIIKQGDGQLSFSHYESLKKTRAAFVEALRMIPPASLLIREATEDTVLAVPRVSADGIRVDESVPIPKGTTIIADLVGMHYNPRIHSSPEVYKPSRWYDTTTDDAYTGFSVGPRSCIGRRFALTESVAFLGNLLKDYTVEPLLRGGESTEEWGQRVLKTTTINLTLNIAETPLIFRRR